MQAGRYDDAAPGAGVDIDVRVYAALADEFQFVEAVEKWSADLGALPDQYQRFSIFQTLHENIDVLNVVVPDGDVVGCELFETGKGAEGVVVVVEDGDLHFGNTMIYGAA
jgi:hypothetical protein